MEMECPTEFPHTHMDRRRRKRATLGWDAVPQNPKAQIGTLCGQEVGDVTSLVSLEEALPSDHSCSSLYSKGVVRNASPPWREDDKDGHYMFAIEFTTKWVKVPLARFWNVGTEKGKHDKNGNRCVQIRNWFDYRNHICIVFEKLVPSLYDFLRKTVTAHFPLILFASLQDNYWNV